MLHKDAEVAHIMYQFYKNCNVYGFPHKLIFIKILSNTLIKMLTLHIQCTCTVKTAMCIICWKSAFIVPCIL